MPGGINLSARWGFLDAHRRLEEMIAYNRRSLLVKQTEETPEKKSKPALRTTQLEGKPTWQPRETDKQIRSQHQEKAPRPQGPKAPRKPKPTKATAKSRSAESGSRSRTEAQISASTTRCSTPTQGVKQRVVKNDRTRPAPRYWEPQYLGLP